MLREFHPRDAPQLVAHYREEFPEDKWLDTDLIQMERLLRRSFGFFPRIALRTARVFGRPILRFFVVELDGGMVGTAFLSYLTNACYVALVQVNPAYRRRGIATELIAACERAARRGRRGYLVLDVLTSNAEARNLYDRLGFQFLESREVLSRETEGTMPPTPVPSGLRPLDRKDAPTLAAISRERQSSLAGQVLPPSPEMFFVRPLVAQALESETTAWVAAPLDQPQGFVRATVSRIMTAGHLTAPLLAVGLSDELARGLIDLGVHWNVERHVHRILCEVPTNDARGRALLEAAGFRPAYGLLTLYRPLNP